MTWKNFKKKVKGAVWDKPVEKTGYYLEKRGQDRMYRQALELRAKEQAQREYAEAYIKARKEKARKQAVTDVKGGSFASTWQGFTGNLKQIKKSYAKGGGVVKTPRRKSKMPSRVVYVQAPPRVMSTRPRRTRKKKTYQRNSNDDFGFGLNF